MALDGVMRNEQPVSMYETETVKSILTNWSKIEDTNYKQMVREEE